MSGHFTFVVHQILVLLAGSVCLFGTWVGMRHFARARATLGSTRIGWLFMASVGTGAALWASTYISILALDPQLNSGFDLVPVAITLAIAILSCLVGFEIGSRHFTLAPELGGGVMGVGILLMHYIGVDAWHFSGTTQWSGYGLALLLLLGLGLSALSVNRANRPVTRWCRHGAAIVLAFMICTMHYALTVSANVVPDPSAVLAPELVPAKMLGVGVVLAVLLVMGSGFSSYVIDMRARTESAERIHQLSFNDSMTGLPNRIAFNERLAFWAAESHERAHKLAALAINIDGFKDVNDLYGHGAGDLLLIEAAARMRHALGEDEFLARQSGDEFLALQMSGSQPADAEQFAMRIAASFAAPFVIRDHTIALTVAIGYSVFPTDTPERDQLLSNAKLAMDRGKATQRGAICAYHGEMDAAARTRRALARDLQSAVTNGELELHYQLQALLEDGTICGAEALMRWNHPKLGRVSPADFIPLAEETDAILDMGEWALRTACRDAAAGRLPGTIAVNLSPVQFGRADLAETIHAILLDTGLSPQRLEIEVTETTLMADQTRGLHILRKLKAMGISIAMDDFGTGYSSLSTLHVFPFDKIKLDQSFVRRIPDDAAACAIVRTVLALGHSLRIPVLAEGIETSAQWHFLLGEGCSKGQGYLYARPVPLAQVPAIIEMAEAVAQAEARTAAAAEMMLIAAA
ncbi:EAL domain-containing protein [Tardiphaga alba]|uniref:EAL domain-containing protein n=1 Tax=Tardiphaga alba TaxID=340268 RepID=A0ABX8AGL8_9BRAD|nr:EAL domain-containing protein [Tardiphaga alba]QUS40955.1 EAL domain-containing protein [Tardiphaga alba]